MNVDLSVALFRDPTGEWICLSARTTIGNDGTGLVNTELFDSDGAIGSAMQTLLVAAQLGSPTDSQ
jgi:acyl-CoA thioesterase